MMKLQSKNNSYAISQGKALAKRQIKPKSSEVEIRNSLQKTKKQYGKEIQRKEEKKEILQKKDMERSKTSLSIQREIEG